VLHSKRSAAAPCFPCRPKQRRTRANGGQGTSPPTPEALIKGRAQPELRDGIHEWRCSLRLAQAGARRSVNRHVFHRVRAALRCCSQPETLSRAQRSAPQQKAWGEEKLRRAVQKEKRSVRRGCPAGGRFRPTHPGAHESVARSPGHSRPGRTTDTG